jgi:negative regulator of sigma-B (phosphoserine phosphatase)
MRERPAEAVPQPTIAWGVADRALAGQAESGDLHVVVPVASGVAVAVIDGLGHGSEAAEAARVAAATLTTHAEKSLADVLQRCHEALRRTRGAVISAASFDTALATLSWTGVGNVDGMLYRGSPEAKPAREALLLRGGVVGFSLPPLRVSELAVSPGDTLVLATDGISSGFKHESMCDRPVQDVADGLLDRYGKPNDDALVLVARYCGAS